jgi:hypothetical protein
VTGLKKASDVSATVAPVPASETAFREPTGQLDGRRDAELPPEVGKPPLDGSDAHLEAFGHDPNGSSTGDEGRQLYVLGVELRSPFGADADHADLFIEEPHPRYGADSVPPRVWDRIGVHEHEPYLSSSQAHRGLGALDRYIALPEITQ